MAAHAHLKNDLTEDEKCHNLMTWLISVSLFQFPVSFVINFVLPKDEALKQVEEENLSTKTLISNADKQKGQSDEADKSRTQVRAAIGEIDKVVFSSSEPKAYSIPIAQGPVQFYNMPLPSPLY